MVNGGVLEYFGRSLQELRQWQMTDSVHPEDLPYVVARWQHAIQTGAPPEWEHRLRRADGDYRWFQLRGFPGVRETTRPVVGYCLITDIHDRKNAEQALRRSEAFLLEVQRLSHTGGWRYDSATDTVEALRRCCALTRCSRAKTRRDRHSGSTGFIRTIALGSRRSSAMPARADPVSSRLPQCPS